MSHQDVPRRGGALSKLTVCPQGHGASPTQEKRTARVSEDGPFVCQAQIADLLQMFKISSEANLAFNIPSCTTMVDNTAIKREKNFHHLIDLECLNTKQAKRVATRRALRDRFGPMMTGMAAHFSLA